MFICLYSLKIGFKVCSTEMAWLRLRERLSSARKEEEKRIIEYSSGWGIVLIITNEIQIEYILFHDLIMGDE